MICYVFIRREIITLLGYLLDGDHDALVFLFVVGGIEAIELIDIVIAQDILSTLWCQNLRAINHQHLAFVSRWLLISEDKETGRKTCAIEELIAQGNDGLYIVVLHQLLTNTAFFIASEENTLRQHDCHATCQTAHTGNHVLKPSVVADSLRWRAPKVSPIAVCLPCFCAPVLQ